MPVIVKTTLLLCVSNIFMLTAWYYHLRQLNTKPWYVAWIASWCIAFFEYSVHIPANRIGHTELSLAQLQILQLGLSLIIFMPFSLIVMSEPVKLDYLWAALCLGAAGYFIFRGMQ